MQPVSLRTPHVQDRMSPSRTTQLWKIAAVAALVTVNLFAGLGRPDLLVPDEGRHSEIAREMLANGAFLTPTLEGQPYYDKPAPFYWLVAASMAVFGINETAVRMPSALAALWTILVMVYFTSRTYSRAAAMLVAAGLATTTLTAILARLVLLDMALTAALTTALAWLGLWLLDPPERRRAIWPFYVAIAVATLLKGPVAIVLAGLLVVVCALAFRDRFAIADLKPLTGSLITAALVAPWYLAAWIKDPDYVETFLFLHNLQRYAVAGALRHEEPFLYYIYTLPLALLPWTTLVIHAFGLRLIRAQQRRAPDLYLAAWASVVIALFLPSQAKIITYMLPAFPPLLALSAAWLAERLELGQPLPVSLRYAGLAWSALVALVLAAAAVYAAVTGDAVSGWLGLATACAGVAALAARRRGPVAAVLCAPALATTLVLLAAAGPGRAFLAETNSLARPAEIIAAEEIPAQRVFAYRRSPHAAAFYKRSVAHKLYWPGDLSARFATPGTAALLTKERHLLLLGLAPLPFDTVVRWRNRRGDVLVIKSPRGDERTAGARTEHGAKPRGWNLAAVACAFLSTFGLLVVASREASPTPH